MSELKQYRQRGVDWDAVSAKVQRHPWATAIVRALEGSFDAFQKAWPGDPPTGLSAWTHHYFCDDDASRLVFDFAKPNEHVCPKCGRVYSGEPWDGAWRQTVHGSIMHSLENAAILARLSADPKRYIEHVRRNVLFYAEHYDEYPVHGKHAGKGKISPQCLDESIMLISMGRYLQWGQGRGWLSDREADVVREKLFKPAVDLLRPQVKIIHNIHAWMQSALATCAQQLGDRELLKWSLSSELGFRNQLAKGTNDDGFWYEGSMTYHYYTFNALASHAMTAAEMGVDVFDEPKFSKMLSAPLGLVYPNGLFPAHNDCWPGRLGSALYEFGAWAWPEQTFARDLEWISAKLGPSRQVGSWTQSSGNNSPSATPIARPTVHALLFGPDDVKPATAPPRKSRIFPASGIAILEGKHDLRLCLRAGPDGGGHDHHDKLNVDVFAAGAIISPDVGTSGYGAAITGKWYRTNAAHNVLLVNGRRQAACNGVIDKQDEYEIVAHADGAYEGVHLSRHIRLTDDGWTDTHRVTSEREATFDYFFHARGLVSLSVETAPAHLGEGDGYAWPREVRGATSDDGFVATWKTPVGELKAHVSGVKGTQAFVSVSDDNPATQPLGVLTLRRRARDATFGVRYTFVPTQPVKP